MRDVHDARLDGALVPRAAEALDGLLVAARDRRRARLLQADDVAAEAEAEVARVFPRDLLSCTTKLSDFFVNCEFRLQCA